MLHARTRCCRPAIQPRTHTSANKRASWKFSRTPCVRCLSLAGGRVCLPPKSFCRRHCWEQQLLAGCLVLEFRKPGLLRALSPSAAACRCCCARASHLPGAACPVLPARVRLVTCATGMAPRRRAATGGWPHACAFDCLGQETERKRKRTVARQLESPQIKNPKRA